MLVPWFLGLLLVFGLGTAEAAVQVRMSEERLTVRAENAPLRDVLQAVAAAGQFSLQLDAPLSDPVTLQFEQKPLLDGLDLLLRDQSSLILHTREQGRVHVQKVVVLAASHPPNRAETAKLSEVFNPAVPPVSPQQILVKLAASADTAAVERIGAALALAEGDNGAAAQDVLVDLLRSREEPNVRQEALVALTGVAPMSLEPVAAAALSDPEPSVRSLALALLSEKAQADPRAGGTLAQAASQDPDADVRQLAQAILQSIQSSNQ